MSMIYLLWLTLHAHASHPFPSSICAGLLGSVRVAGGFDAATSMSRADGERAQELAADLDDPKIRTLVHVEPNRSRAIELLRRARAMIWAEQARAESDLYGVRFAGVPLLRDPVVAWWHRLRDRPEPDDADAPEGWSALASMATGLGLLTFDDPSFHLDFFVRYVIQRDRQFAAELGLAIEILELGYTVDTLVSRNFDVSAFTLDDAGLVVDGRLQAERDLASMLSRIRRRIVLGVPMPAPTRFKVDVFGRVDGSVVVVFRIPQ